MALSCHLSMDLLCQEMRDACVGELRVSRLSSLLVFRVARKDGEGVLMPKFSLSM